MLIPDKITLFTYSEEGSSRPTSSTVSSFSETDYFAILSIMPLEVVIMVMLLVVVMVVVMVVHYA